MATIDAGSRREGARSTNHELPLVPFIDFLICLVVFLLAQVGFARMARLHGDALVPGKTSEHPALSSKRMHLDVRGQRARVSWRRGQTVLVSNDLPLEAVTEGAGVRRYPGLARFLDRDFRVNGAHQDPTDPVLDEAVLHVSNSAAYEDLIAVLDALSAPRRAVPGSGQSSAFAVSLAVD